MELAATRLNLFRNQLAVNQKKLFNLDESLVTKENSLNSINKKYFKSLLFPRNDEREKILNEIAKDPDFIKYKEMEESQQNPIMIFNLLVKYFQMINADYEDFQKNTNKYYFSAEILFFFDQAMGIRLGVDFELSLTSLVKFGTEKHLPLIKRLFSLEDFGCFALTELGHGSNARSIQTTAEYDIEAKEFIINTPSNSALKFWIGSAYKISSISIVFAQLIIQNKEHGIHAFIVPIRDKIADTKLKPGVRIGDCGPKIGLNNIDNGFIHFNNVRIPRENLLDRISQVSEEGNFTSNMKGNLEHFGFLLGSILNRSRIFLCSRVTMNLLSSLTIACRFSMMRRQFGTNNLKQETAIIDYQNTQYRLMPYLAGAITMRLVNLSLYELWENNKLMLMDYKNSLAPEIHALISTIKTISSWFSRKGIQECRDLCGAFGYSGYSRLPQIYNDNDINTTWEGDNNVLLQQTAKFLFECTKHIKNGNKIPYQSLDFLKYKSFLKEKCEIRNKKEFMRISELIKIFQHRLMHLMHISIKIIDINERKFQNSFEVWNHSQVFFLRDAALAYGELYIIKEIGNKISKINDKRTRKIIKKCASLYALKNIEENLTQFSDYFSVKHISILKESILFLCAEIKKDMMNILDIIAAPDEIRDSPIGSSDGYLYTKFLQKSFEMAHSFEKPSWWPEIYKKT